MNIGRSGGDLEEFAGKSIVPTHGSGAYLKTETGEEYVDYILNHGSLLLGHAHPDIVRAVREQITAGSIFFPSDRTAQTLGNRIIKAVPCAESLVFTSTGTEATYLALRLARAYTGRKKILKFTGAYNGWHDYAFQSTQYSGRDESLEAICPEGTVDSAGIPHEPGEFTLVAPFNDVEYTETIVEQHGADLAAIIVEPFMKSIEPIEGFLEGLREICDVHNVVLIFDEIMTGFRLAYGGAQEYYGVTPDVATIGKAIGGGLPLAAVCGSRSIIDLVGGHDPATQVYAAGTHRHNSLCAKAGLAALEVLAQPGTYRSFDRYTDTLKGAIVDILEDAAIPCTPLGAGPLYNYILADDATVTRWSDRFIGDSETKRALDRALLNQGVLVKVGMSRRYISTEHHDRELELTIEAYKQAVESIR